MVWTIPNTLTILRLIAAPCVALVFVAFPRPIADWVAFALFVGASLTDWFDGHLARRWNQKSRFGALLDPIADKAMVVITLAAVMALSGLDPWLVVPVTFILFREVFVSGLREFLGASAGRLQVTRLAKWKTTVQMVAITLLLFGLALKEELFWIYRSMVPEDYQAHIASGPHDWNGVWLLARSSAIIAQSGLVLIWLAAVLTVITGWDYFRKSLPYLREPAE
ncbi:MAG: CDP-diacylglycerol--glycerol-3-phosphate 3-phosphatidyltransferase [Rhodobacteraceae bacterium]|nr:CDP-diacylglycerol--glycerol-3-phosphate 3-phosphatidyltransferase [Paracoccaceae bacterium]